MAMASRASPTSGNASIHLLADRISPALYPERKLRSGGHGWKGKARGTRLASPGRSRRIVIMIGCPPLAANLAQEQIIMARLIVWLQQLNAEFCKP
jgi:hypothetical protein